MGEWLARVRHRALAWPSVTLMAVRVLTRLALGEEAMDARRLAARIRAVRHQLVVLEDMFGVAPSPRAVHSRRTPGAATPAAAGVRKQQAGSEGGDTATGRTPTAKLEMRPVRPGSLWDRLRRRQAMLKGEAGAEAKETTSAAAADSDNDSDGGSGWSLDADGVAATKHGQADGDGEADNAADSTEPPPFQVVVLRALLAKLRLKV